MAHRYELIRDFIEKKLGEIYQKHRDDLDTDCPEELKAIWNIVKRSIAPAITNIDKCTERDSLNPVQIYADLLFASKGYKAAKWKIFMHNIALDIDLLLTAIKSEPHNQYNQSLNELLNEMQAEKAAEKASNEKSNAETALAETQYAQNLETTRAKVIAAQTAASNAEKHAKSSEDLSRSAQGTYEVKVIAAIAVKAKADAIQARAYANQAKTILDNRETLAAMQITAEKVAAEKTAAEQALSEAKQSNANLDQQVETAEKALLAAEEFFKTLTRKSQSITLGTPEKKVGDDFIDAASANISFAKKAISSINALIQTKNAVAEKSTTDDATQSKDAGTLGEIKAIAMQITHTKNQAISSTRKVLDTADADGKTTDSQSIESHIQTLKTSLKTTEEQVSAIKKKIRSITTKEITDNANDLLDQADADVRQIKEQIETANSRAKELRRAEKRKEQESQVAAFQSTQQQLTVAQKDNQQLKLWLVELIKDPGKAVEIAKKHPDELKKLGINPDDVIAKMYFFRSANIKEIQELATMAFMRAYSSDGKENGQIRPTYANAMTKIIDAAHTSEDPNTKQHYIFLYTVLCLSKNADNLKGIITDLLTELSKCDAKLDEQVVSKLKLVANPTDNAAGTVLSADELNCMGIPLKTQPTNLTNKDGQRVVVPSLFPDKPALKLMGELLVSARANKLTQENIDQAIKKYTEEHLRNYPIKIVVEEQAEVATTKQQIAQTILTM